LSSPPPPHRSLFVYHSRDHRALPSFPTRRSSDLVRRLGRLEALRARAAHRRRRDEDRARGLQGGGLPRRRLAPRGRRTDRREDRSEEHTSELQSPYDLVCRLLLEKKNKTTNSTN